MSTTTHTIFGSTGLVGKNILSTLLESPDPAKINTISRRAPLHTPHPSLNAIIEKDNSAWTNHLSTIVSPNSKSTVTSALGTTRAQAGGIANQWKIDHDLNVEIARAAKAAGADIFVFVSSGGTRNFAASYSPYAKMKNGVEDTLRELEFEQTIVLKPGVIMGQREGGQALASAFGSFVGALGRVSAALRDGLGQDATVIARAAVAAEELAREGKAPSKFWVLESSDIVRLGRDEWNA